MTTAPISEQEIAQLTTKGTLALEGWFKELAGNIGRGAKAEVSIEDVKFSSNLTLTGKIDAVLLPDSWDNVSPVDVEVVDFKTKKPMSHNAILGNTKDASGNEFRQLVFYRLLLDSWRDGVWRMKTGVIEFLEPNASSNYKREVFAISNEDCAKLKETIASLEQQLLDASFIDSYCDDTECRYCAMAKTL
jgi:DNA helicase-2/ATP-dependent DNA helicase PcrA